MKTCKQKLAYIALGGVLMLIGMIVSSCVLMPSVAQRQREKFGDIECTSLTVVDEDRKAMTVIMPEFNVLTEKGNGTIWTTFREHGGEISITDVDQRTQLRLGINEHGGYVYVEGKSKGSAIMGIAKDGNGAMSTYDKNGYLVSP